MLAELGKNAVKAGSTVGGYSVRPVCLAMNLALDFLESVGASHKQARGDSFCFHLPANDAAEVVFNAARAG